MPKAGLTTGRASIWKVAARLKLRHRWIACRFLYELARCCQPPTQPVICKKTEEPTRALRYYAAPPSPTSVASETILFEDNGLQTTHADNQRVIHTFHAISDRDTLRIEASQQGSWQLPYEQIRVILPQGEKRTLHLATNGVPLTR